MRKSTFYGVVAFLITFVLMLLLFLPHAKADWFDNEGVRAFYGTSSMTTIGPTPTEVDSYNWTSISYLLEKNIYNWLDVDTTIGVGYLDSSVKSSPSVEGRILFKAHYEPFYFSVGGGLAYLFYPDHMPDLADSCVYGLISGEVGLHFIESKNFDLRAGYMVEHISSPLHGGETGDNNDPGWNIGGLCINLTWKF